MDRRRTIAVLVDYLVGDYQIGLIRGAEMAAIEHDVNLVTVVGRPLLAPYFGDRAQNDVYYRIKQATFDGVIVGSGCIGTSAGPEQLAELCSGYAPLSLCSIGVYLPGVPSLVISNFNGMKIIIDHLIDQHDCRNIAYVRGPLASVEAEERLQGYKTSLLEHGIEFDPELVHVGNFMGQSGADGAKQWLQRGVRLDAIAAANDYMALGAIDVLRQHGLRVPHDILVTGFDDISMARVSAPSLTTVRQPVELLGHLALETVLQQLKGKPVPERLETNVEMMTRQSCGCAYRVLQARSSNPAPDSRRTAMAEINLRKEHLRKEIVASLAHQLGDLEIWPAALLDALEDEIAGHQGRFLLEVERILNQVDDQGLIVNDLSMTLSVLRSQFRNTLLEAGRESALEDLWHAAVLLIGAATTRGQVHLRIDYELAVDVLRQGVARLSTALNEFAVSDALGQVLLSHGIESSCVVVYADASCQKVRCIHAQRHGFDFSPSGEAYPVSAIVPTGFFPVDRRSSYLLMPLTFGVEPLGLLVMESGAIGFVYTMLREQICSALKGGALHRDVVQQTQLRERAERKQLKKEAIIAQEIQTAILPRQMQVPGFELAAVMLPAADVGGDYYDVIPTSAGCWLGIGDVAGHGLLAGLEMLMIQSMVAAMVTKDPEASPADIIISLNHALFENVRHRLHRDEHATLAVIRFDSSGTMTFAGCHEDFVICRCATGACEQVVTPGFWVGAVPDLMSLTADGTAALSPGDILVLYSDGVVEPRNHNNEQFGMLRLRQVIEACRQQPVQAICSSVIEAAQAWAPSQEDDMTVLVARYLGTGPSA